MKKRGFLKTLIIAVIVIIVLGAVFGKDKDEEGKESGPGLKNEAETSQGFDRSSDNIIKQSASNSTERNINNEPAPIENTKKTDPSKEKTDEKEIRKELKDFVDSYEDFMDEYCEFMESYDSSSISMLAKYTSLMGKYAEFAKKADEWKEGDMTDAEVIYYMEAMNRIEIKLLKTNQKIGK